MTAFPRPRIVVSRCLGFDHCRWNGLMASSDVVRLLREYVEFLPVCPEVEIGLGVPRDPVRIIRGAGGGPRLVQPASGGDYTGEMTAHVAELLDSLSQVDGFVLKSRSPTCGIKDVKHYHSIERGAGADVGAGFLGAAVRERFAHLAVEDEGRLTNYGLRHHYLTQIFSFAAMRQVAAIGTVGAWVQFQAENKLLLMAYSQQEMRALGRIVANREGLSASQVTAAYREHFYQALSRPPRSTSHINVLMHAFGYFELSGGEKRYFLECLEDYRAGRIPLSVCIAIVYAWIVRFEQAYLAQQRYFAPYPEDLLLVTDSGKGRTL